MNILRRGLWAFMAASALVAGCATAPTVSLDAPPSPSLPFLDVSSFDRELAASLRAGIDKVEVGFYDPVSPNQLPARIEKWIAAVQQSGGKITVQRPAGEPAPKGPLVLASLIGAAFNSAKTLAAIQQEQLFASAKGRDAVLVLERDQATSRVQVVRIVFVPTAR